MLALGKVAAEPGAAEVKGRRPLVAGPRLRLKSPKEWKRDSKAASPRVPTEAVAQGQSWRAKCSRPDRPPQSLLEPTISWSCILAARGEVGPSLKAWGLHRLGGLPRAPA